MIKIFIDSEFLMNVSQCDADSAIDELEYEFDIDDEFHDENGNIHLSTK